MERADGQRHDRDWEAEVQGGGESAGDAVVGDGRLAADEAERAAVARARELRAEGRSLREIAAVLDAEGHRPRGKRWHVQTLARVVAGE